MKSVNADIEKINTQIEKKRTSIVTLQQEVKELEIQLKECNELRDQITRDNAQQQINVLLSDKSLQTEQLGKIVGVISRLKNEINDLDENDIVEALKMVVDDRKTNNTEKSVVNDNAGKNT